MDKPNHPLFTSHLNPPLSPESSRRLTAFRISCQAVSSLCLSSCSVSYFLSYSLSPVHTSSISTRGFLSRSPVLLVRLSSPHIRYLSPPVPLIRPVHSHCSRVFISSIMFFLEIDLSTKIAPYERERKGGFITSFSATVVVLCFAPSFVRSSQPCPNHCISS